MFDSPFTWSIIEKERRTIMFKWLFSISITEEWNDIQELRKRQNTEGMCKYKPKVYRVFLYARLIRIAISLVRDTVVLALLVKLFLL